MSTNARFMVLQHSDNRGVAALVSVLVFGGFAIAVTVGLVVATTRALHGAMVREQGYVARAAAIGCAEIALAQIQADTAYTGSGSATIGSATCTYSVTNGGGDVRTIDATGTFGRATAHVAGATDALSPQVTLGSWEE